MGLNGCCSCVKYLMVLINILFWVCRFQQQQQQQQCEIRFSPITTTTGTHGPPFCARVCGCCVSECVCVVYSLRPSFSRLARGRREEPCARSLESYRSFSPSFHSLDPRGAQNISWNLFKYGLKYLIEKEVKKYK